MSRSWADNWANTEPGKPHKSRGLPAIVAGLVVVPIAALAWLLPPALVLPASSLVLLSAALVIAFAAWLARVETDAPCITLWDLAGAFAFIGFAAGSLSEPSHAAHLLGIALVVP